MQSVIFIIHRLYDINNSEFYDKKYLLNVGLTITDEEAVREAFLPVTIHI